jgi:hypothetical protein
VFCQTEGEGVYRVLVDLFLRPIFRYQTQVTMVGVNRSAHASRHNEERRTPQVVVSKQL